jgi:predicted house-cleaning noncanonical NTP pyrophosphatase (MazG superfamily)
MATILYNKLVRDLIPKVIQDDGHTATTRVLNDDEFRQALLDKLVEEAQELKESEGDIKERADVAEVLKALDELQGWDVEEARLEKTAKRGGFEKRIFLEKEETND